MLETVRESGQLPLGLPQPPQEAAEEEVSIE